jgi:hypothetical protein
VTSFRANVFSQELLAAGATEVHALVAVKAEGASGPVIEAAEVILVDCSGSMGHPPEKIVSARAATRAAIDRLRDGTWFAIVAGTASADLIYPDVGLGLALASDATRAEASARVSRLQATDGTAISTWLAMARDLFAARSHALHHAVLLTDGRNQGEEPETLHVELERCQGAFVCDCRGIGADWDHDELQGIAHALLGDVDIIPRPAEMEAAFEAIVERTMGRRAASVEIIVRTPVTVSVSHFSQCFPEIMDLSGRVAWWQPDDGWEWRPVASLDPEGPLGSHYPTGPWAGDEEREYHLALRVVANEPGKGNELRAAVVRLLVDGTEVSSKDIQVQWTHDLSDVTRMDERLTRYLELGDMVPDIREGLKALDAGDDRLAATLLMRAYEVAVRTGNPKTAMLLGEVVDITTGELRPGSTRLIRQTLRTQSSRVTASSETAPPAPESDS